MKRFINFVSLGLVFSLVFGLLLMVSITARADNNEPYWANFVKKYYPHWRNHYWVDRELWGNRGYIIGQPPKLPNEIAGTGALEVKPVVIKEEPMKVVPKKLAEKPAVHKVKKGECLWYIAGYSEVYGNPLKWPLIYKANKDKIKNPDLIYPGQVLVIPRD